MAAFAFPFLGRRGHRDAEGARHARPGSGVSPGPGLGVDREDRPLGVRTSGRSWLDPFEQRGADPHERRPFLDRGLEIADIPIESSGSGRPVRAKLVADLAEADERGPGGFAVGALRRHRHQPDDREAPARGDRFGVVEDLSGDQPCLASSPEVLTCRQTRGGSVHGAEVVEVPKQLERIDRVDHATMGSVRFALFDWRCPMRCQRIRARCRPGPRFLQSSCG